jgi:hypothetical protein
VDLDAFTSSVSTGGSRLGSRGMYVHIHIDVCIIHELIAAVLNELQETSSGRDESTNMLPRCGEMADTIGLQCSLHIAGKMSWQDWLKDAEEYSRQRLFSRYQRSQLAIKNGSARRAARRAIDESTSIPPLSSFVSRNFTACRIRKSLSRLSRWSSAVFHRFQYLFTPTSPFSIT